MKPKFDHPNGAQIYLGDSLEVLKELPDASVQCCITSPPYYGLRDYGNDGQIGRESTLTEYIDSLVKLFSEVKRVLRDDGTLWCNMGDTYTTVKTQEKNYHLKPKDLMGVPWRLAFALQDDGWYLRQDIVWSKKSPMPEPAKDRCTKSHESIFLLSKSMNYYFNHYAIQVPALTSRMTKAHFAA